MTDLDFAGLIKQDREERKHQHFSGTLLDYLAIVKKDPKIAMLAHQRMHELLNARGVEAVNGEDNPRLKRLYANIRRHF